MFVRSKFILSLASTKPNKLSTVRSEHLSCPYPSPVCVSPLLSFSVSDHFTLLLNFTFHPLTYCTVLYLAEPACFVCCCSYQQWEMYITVSVIRFSDSTKRTLVDVYPPDSLTVSLKIT